MYYVVYKGKDGFQKEEEREFIGGPDYQIKTRTWERMSDYRVLPPGFATFTPVTAIDRTFRLTKQLFAMGKNIAYYEET
jgi:hypothetical protein